MMPDGLKAGPPPGQWRGEQLEACQYDRLFADILVPISGQEMGWQALEQALEVARREGARLRGLHVVSSEAQRDGEEAQAVRAEFNRRCEAAGIPGELLSKLEGWRVRYANESGGPIWPLCISLTLRHPNRSPG